MLHPGKRGYEKKSIRRMMMHEGKRQKRQEKRNKQRKVGDENYGR
jgi:hypothetical protein